LACPSRWGVKSIMSEAALSSKITFLRFMFASLSVTRHEGAHLVA
jgi:hypothetical protein